MSFISLDQLPFVGTSYDEVNTPCRGTPVDRPQSRLGSGE